MIFTLDLVILNPIPDKCANTIAQLWTQIFCLFGFPKVIQSDNGTEFVNNIITQLAKKSGITHRLVTPYNPRANGSAERTVQTAVQLISKLIHGYKNNWDNYVNFTQYCINQKISERHKETPFFAAFGRRANSFNDYSNIEFI